ncbi:MAG TPA: hypothetical protein VJP86_14820 [Vicinamibacterales bacterium]|nr:hypothetical protein [Vicinamibacterales bacterium]
MAKRAKTKPRLKRAPRKANDDDRDERSSAETQRAALEQLRKRSRPIRERFQKIHRLGMKALRSHRIAESTAAIQREVDLISKQVRLTNQFLIKLKAAQKRRQF